MLSKIAFKFKESILILIRSLTFAKLFIILQSKSAKPSLCYCVVFESRNWSFEREHWSLGDDLVHFHILHFIYFNLVGYDLYQLHESRWCCRWRWWGIEPERGFMLAKRRKPSDFEWLSRNEWWSTKNEDKMLKCLKLSCKIK